MVDVLTEYSFDKDHAKILDVASGTGRIAHNLAAQISANIYTVDLSFPMLMVYAKKLDSLHLNAITPVSADMRHLPFPDNTFDAVTLGSFLYLLPKLDYPTFVSDIMRVLKPKGIFLCEVSNALNLLNPGSFFRVLFQKPWRNDQVKSYIYPWAIARAFPTFHLARVIGTDYFVRPLNHMLAFDHFHQVSCMLGRSPFIKALGGKLVLVLRKVTREH